MPPAPPDDAKPLEEDWPHQLSWSSTLTAAELKAAPNRPAVYLLVDGGGQPVQLATTQQLRRLLHARFLETAEARRARADLGAVVRGVWWREVACPFEASWRYYRVARRLDPANYRKQLAFGPAWFLHHRASGGALREIEITARPHSGGRGAAPVDGPEAWLGPWATRSEAQRALEGLWDLFDLCRHPEQLRRAPHGRRCAYADMGRCDAPCDGSVTPDAMTARTAAAWRLACEGPSAWIAAAEERMQAAAAAQQFERAAGIRQQLDFARFWARHWSGVIRPYALWRLLVAFRVTGRRAWKLFAFVQGALADGPVVRERVAAAAAAEWLAELAATPPTEPDPVVRDEQSWLVAKVLLDPAHSAAGVVLPLDEARGERLAEALRPPAAAGDAVAESEA